jgi:hypothetical protein
MAMVVDGKLRVLLVRELSTATRSRSKWPVSSIAKMASEQPKSARTVPNRAIGFRYCLPSGTNMARFIHHLHHLSKSRSYNFHGRHSAPQAERRSTYLQTESYLPHTTQRQTDSFPVLMNQRLSVELRLLDNTHMKSRSIPPSD